MRFFCGLLLLQLAMMGVLWAACFLFVRHSPPSFAPALHVPVWLLVGCMLACTVMFWRAVDPQLNRIGLELLSNATRFLIVPVMIGWYALALGTFVLVLAVPASASTGWSFAPMLAAGTVLVLLCAAAFILSSVLVTREKQAIAQAQAVLESFRPTCAPEELARIQEWIDWRRGGGSSRPPVMIRGAYFPGLLRRPWHDADVFAWERELQAALPQVREELLAIYGASKEGFRKYNYVGSADKNWKVFPLFRDHQKVEANCARCPETTRLVERITGGLTRDVMVSLLEPHAYIAPHRDSGNLFLTGHYGLVVPEGCAMRVHEETRVWSKGRSLLFDTSFEHEVWNRGEGIRMVLLYEFLHPDLTAVERRFFSTLFQATASQRAGSSPSGAPMRGTA